MKKIFILLLALLPLQAVQAWARQRPKVGVVLSGGGAKGAAHIGVLRAVEDAGLPIDYVVGTSMGAIVGGLYAMGYSTAQLDTLMRTLDWEFLMSDRAPRRELSPAQRERSERFVLNIPLSRKARPELTGLVRGRNWGNTMARLTVGYHDSISFDSLRIPFACVATNLANGDEVVLRSGVLAQAIRASMAFPGMLTPVEINGKTLIDGGMANNFPVDVARRMGADIVVGATVQRPFADTLTIKGPQSVISQITAIASRHKFEDNVRDCDIYIGVNPQEVSTMDFDTASIDTMIRRGYETAMAQRTRLDSVAALTGRVWPEARQKTVRQAWIAPQEDASFDIREITFDRITVAEERIIRRACSLKSYSRIRSSQIDKAVRLLSERFLYVDATYSLNAAAGRYDLIFHARRRMSSQIGVGARFDTEELASVLLDGYVVFPTHVPTTLDVSGRLSEQYGAQVTLTAEPWLNRQLSVSYSFRHHNQDVYHKGRRWFNLVYQQQQAGFAYANRMARNFDFEVGAEFYRFDFADVLITDNEHELAKSPKSDTYFSGYVRLKYNSENRTYYPTCGTKFYATYSFTTDHLFRLKRPHSFSTVMASWEMVVPLRSRWALLPRVSGRLVLSPESPYVFSNAVGGWQMGKYVAQQLPFPGLSHLEIVRNALLMADFRLRYNFFRRQYATFQGAVLAEHRDLNHLRRANYEYGLGLHYGYDTKLGPVEVAMSYSGRCRRPTFYLNVGYEF